MKVMIKCNCGNVVDFSVEPGKVAMFRDYLRQQQFCCDIQNTEASRMKEIMVICNKCKKWIVLSMD